MLAFDLGELVRLASLEELPLSSLFEAILGMALEEG